MEACHLVGRCVWVRGKNIESRASIQSYREVSAEIRSAVRASKMLRASKVY